jgi:hypothetical protein
LATAYHEAGHAVITFAQGLTVHKVSIVPGEEYNGVCVEPGVARYHPSNSREQRAIARAQIVSYYAGMPAQRLVNPKPPEHHGASDEDAAFALSRQFLVLPRYCSHIGDERHDAYRRRLRQEACRLVGKHRRAIDLLASHLFRRQELQGEEALRLIEPLLSRQASRPPRNR